MYDPELVLILSLHIEVIGICCLRFLFHLYLLTPTEYYKYLFRTCKFMETSVLYCFLNCLLKFIF